MKKETKSLDRIIFACGVIFVLLLMYLIFYVGHIDTVAKAESDPLRSDTKAKVIQISVSSKNKKPVVKKVIKKPAPFKITVTTKIPNYINKHISKVAKGHGYKISLIKAIIEKESSFNPKTISRTHDYGLGGLNRSLLPWIKKQLKSKYPKFDPLNPIHNIDGIVVYLDSIRDAYKRAKHRLPTDAEMLVSYNMGVGGASRYMSRTSSRGIYHPYYKGVLKLYKQYLYLEEGK